MKTVLKVEGMSCNHCKAAVEGALKEVEGVTTAQVSLEAKQVEVEHAETVAKTSLVDAIEEQGYDVVSS